MIIVVAGGVDGGSGRLRMDETGGYGDEGLWMMLVVRRVARAMIILT